jgi:TonB family protein
MKKLSTILILSLAVQLCFGQNGSEDPIPYDSVAIKPEYAGGMAEFTRFLEEHIRYPRVANENGIQGVVHVSFVVARDGQVVNVKAINDVDSLLSREVVKIVSMSRRWRPGQTQNQRWTPVLMEAKVHFILTPHSDSIKYENNVADSTRLNIRIVSQANPLRVAFITHTQRKPKFWHRINRKNRKNDN